MEATLGAARKRHVLIVEDNVELGSTYKELLEVVGSPGTELEFAL